MNKVFYTVYHKENSFFYDFSRDPLYLKQFGDPKIPHLSVNREHAEYIYNYNPSDRVLLRVEMTVAMPQEDNFDSST